MVSHKCVAWSAFGNKTSGLDVPFLRVKDNIKSRTMSTNKINISAERQVFDVDQIRLKEFDGTGIKFHDLDGKILSKISSVPERRTNVVLEVESSEVISEETLSKMVEELKSKGVVSIVSIQ